MHEYGYIDEDDYRVAVAEYGRQFRQKLRRLRRDANQCEECGADLDTEGLPFVTFGIVCEHCHKELFA